MNAFGDYLLDRSITLQLHAGSGVAGPVLVSRTLDAAALIGGGRVGQGLIDLSLSNPAGPRAGFTTQANQASSALAPLSRSLRRHARMVSRVPWIFDLVYGSVRTAVDRFGRLTAFAP